MDRNQFYKILKKYPKFVLKKDLSYKQIQHALKFVIPGVKEDDFIAFYSTGVLNNGKKGMAITKHALYESETRAKVVYLGLDTVRHRQKDSSTSEFQFIYADGRTEQYAFAYPKASELSDLIIEIASGILTEQNMIARMNQLAQESPKEPVKTEEELAKEAEELREKALSLFAADEKEKAYALFEQSAELGNAKSMDDMGHAYSFGECRTQNYETALYWYEKAAQKNDSHAMYEAGWLYKTGRGCEVDEKKAFDYFLKAADQRERYAALEVALCYRDAIGTPVDKEKARQYYEIAAQEAKSYTSYQLFRTEARLNALKSWLYPEENTVLEQEPSVKEEPAKVEPVKAEPIKAEPVKVEPAKVEPIKAEPAKVEPVKTEPIKETPVQETPKVTPQMKYKKMDFAWDLNRIQNNASNDDRNSHTLSEMASLVDWSNALKGKEAFEIVDDYEDDLLEHVARSYYFSGLLKQSLNAYRVYLDRHDDLHYDLPQDMRDYVASSDFSFKKDGECLVHVRALYELVRDYSFAKRHPEAAQQIEEKKAPKKPEPKPTSVFRDYMVIDADRCIACGGCEGLCDAIKEDPVTKLPKVDPKLCDQCFECFGVCPVEAIS